MSYYYSPEGARHEDSRRTFMPRDEIGSVRFEKETTIRMIRVEGYDSSNVNDPRDRRDVVTTLAEVKRAVHPNKVADEIASVLST
jgi:hypothetical protein